MSNHLTTMKGIPKSEEVCVWHYNEGGSELLFATTRDFKGMFKLYFINNNVATFTKMKSHSIVHLYYTMLIFSM